MLQIIMLLTVLLDGPESPAEGRFAAPQTAAIFSADGNTVFVGSQAGIAEYAWPQLSLRRSVTVPVENIHDMVLTMDQGALLIAGGTPGESGQIVEVDLATERLQTTEVGEDVVFRIGLIHCEKTLIAATAQAACLIIERESGRIGGRFDGHSGAVLALQPITDDFVASAGIDQTLRLWNPEDGRLIRTLNNHVAAINDLAIIRPTDQGSDGLPVTMQLASTGDDRTVRLWYPDTGRLLRFVKLPSIARSLAVSVDGTRLYAGCDDGVVRCLEVASLRLLRETPTSCGRIFALVRHPKTDDLLTAGQTGLTRVPP